MRQSPTALTPISTAGERTAPNAELKSYSCLICRKRKTKCDRRNPCSNCVKTRRECSFVPPVRGKRPKTKLPYEGLHAKLRRYEDLLKSYGAKIEATEHEEESDEETVCHSWERTGNAMLGNTGFWNRTYIAQFGI
jgi:hypothetical protein